MKGFVADIEELTEENSDCRRVLYTGKKLQLVLMAIKPGGEIGEEVHEDRDQFFRVEKGKGEVLIDGNQYTGTATLKSALPIVPDPVSWTEYVHAIQTAGFRSSQNITSNMNIVYSYVIFVLGRTRYGVQLAELRTLIARWLFMSQLTARYTGSSESQIQKDLDRIEAVASGDAVGFAQVLNEIVDSQLTSDFWRYNMPQQLITSGPGLSPQFRAPANPSPVLLGCLEHPGRPDVHAGFAGEGLDGSLPASNQRHRGTPPVPAGLPGEGPGHHRYQAHQPSRELRAHRLEHQHHHLG